MKILIFIPVYKRPEITRMCYTGLKRIIKAAPKKFDIQVLTITSNDEDKRLAHEFFFNTFDVENLPLGNKFNKGMSAALRIFDFDYVMQMNSDDLLSTDYWRKVTPYLDNRIAYFGVDHLYFFDSETKCAKYFKYALGCGIRFIRRDVIEIAGFGDGNEFKLWDPSINIGLDNNSDLAIAERTNVAQIFMRKGAHERPIVVDVKSELNLHSFKEFAIAPELTTMEYDYLFKRFPELHMVSG